MSETIEYDALDRQIINALQGGFPIVDESKCVGCGACKDWERALQCGYPDMSVVKEHYARFCE